MSTDLNPNQQAILANLKVLNTLLKKAHEITEEGLEHAHTGDQNTLVGGLMLVNDSIDQAKSLYEAILTLHRTYPQK